MTKGLIALVLAYVLSQFYRTFLAVLSPVLESDIGATPDQLAVASGFWFTTFAIMQIPVGWALDKIGPRLTATVLMSIGGAGGAAVMALATGPGAVSVSMILIGIGCSPILMSSYYILARTYPPAIFATYAAVIIGIGSIGNIGAAKPLAWAIESFGWRGALWGLAALTLASSLSLWALIRNPAPVEGEEKGSILDILKIPALYPIFIMMLVNYAPVAGIRGLWIAPYLGDVFDANLAQIGNATLIMGLAMIAGNFFYGPLDRIFNTRKWVVFFGNSTSVLACLSLWLWADLSFALSVALIAVIGFFSMSFPVILAHGRSFIPPHLTGRGVTLLNLFGIGGAGIMQFASGPVFIRLSDGATEVEAYSRLFGLFGLLIAFGCLIYLFSRDRTG